MRSLILLLWIFCAFSCSRRLSDGLLPPATQRTWPKLEKQANEWTIYKDIMFPGDSVYGSIRNLQNNETDLLLCQLDSGNAYNNIFFTRSLEKSWNRKHWCCSALKNFTLEMEFYIDARIDSLNSDNTEVEGIEFIFQQAIPPNTWTWGLQWSKQQRWYIWNDQMRAARTNAWVPLPIGLPELRSNVWNKIVLHFNRNKKRLIYKLVEINANKIRLNQSLPSTGLPEDWVENFLQVGFQINGNISTRPTKDSSVDPVKVYLRNIQLQGKS